MKQFRLLVLGNGVSAYGSYLNMVALNVFVYDVTGSALAAGLFMAVRLGTSVGAGFVSGRLVSAYDRKRLIIGADLGQALALLVLLLAPEAGRISLLYCLAVVTGGCSTLSQVALRSSIPEIVGAEHRTRANSLLVTGRSLAMIAGFASAGVVVAQLGYTAAFVLDAGTFLVSASVLMVLPIRTRARSEGPGGAEEGAPGTGHRSLRLLWAGAPVLMAMIAVRAVDGLGSSSHNVALPVYSSLLDPAHPATFISQFWATWAVGTIIAQQVLARHNRRTGRTLGERAFAVGACVMSGAFIIVFSGLPTVPALATALLAGAADGVTEVVYVSRLQLVPDEQRGRLFGLSASAENAGFGLGMLISGSLLESFSPFQVVASLHGLAIVLCLALLTLLVLRRSPAGPGRLRETGDAAVREGRG
ncbi:MFS transporter [Streptomyces sp. NBC_00257]|uniref:MFS transporter n=1 Tax=Streptomyces TaxID=1883 RepID=UPI0022575CA1|nr:MULTISPECIES: MFS transporter [unclassified Streptomyces]WSW05841.1 MFS transporter [Streptomyces sp. NBC_01005]WTC95345.1 MFS transporter [Streptomyces sp. NBC_01650]MCX4864970.1 MFS transporter [Streptomyces sp. NBC_00906]MCX4896208.1 MFS transporter [Streptomyces sp. NBC_00892]MCX5429497.1 MFS transporter [Streptomyces sp. NBC_00062]